MPYFQNTMIIKSLVKFALEVHLDEEVDESKIEYREIEEHPECVIITYRGKEYVGENTPSGYIVYDPEKQREV